MHKSSNKVIVIGLDGATFDLIEPWARKGELPTFAKFMEEGSWGDLESTILPLTAPAWSSFMTGKNPGKHGVYDFTKRVKGTYSWEPISAHDRYSDSIYKIVSEAGKKVISLGVPATFPPEKVNGAMVSGPFTPGKGSNFTYPEGLKQELNTVVGEYPIYLKNEYSPGKEEKLLKEWGFVTKKRKEAALYVTSNYDWDFFVVVFMGIDWCSHWFYHFMDSTHPLYDPDKGRLYGSFVLDMYKMVDCAINEMLRSLKCSKENFTVIFMSDHGFGPMYKSIFLNTWLMSEGYLKLKGTYFTRFKEKMHKNGFTLKKVYDFFTSLGMTERLKGNLGRSTQEGLRRRLLDLIFLSYNDVDWSRTKAYSTGNFGQLYINLKGREPEGIVKPGKEYKELRDELSKKLLELKNPENGDRIIEKVFTKEEVYWGKYLEEACDLLYFTKDLSYVSTTYFEFGSNKLVDSPHRSMSGNHRRNGIFLIKGSDVQPGTNISGASIFDLAPTILHLLDVDVPEDMDGEVLKQVWLPGSRLRNKKVKRSGKHTDRVKARKELTEQEKQMIAKRLRAMGYFD